VSSIEYKFSFICSFSECAGYCKIHVENFSSLFFLTTMNVEGWFLCRSETIPISSNSDVLLGKFRLTNFHPVSLLTNLPLPINILIDLKKY
jgi:hypothetical protein